MSLITEYTRRKQHLMLKGWPGWLFEKVSTFTVQEWENQGLAPDQIVYCKVCKKLTPSLKRTLDRDIYYECSNCLALNEHNIASQSPSFFFKVKDRETFPLTAK